MVNDGLLFAASARIVIGVVEQPDQFSKDKDKEGARR
jgi:hypothetical protein